MSSSGIEVRGGVEGEEGSGGEGREGVVGMGYGAEEGVRGKEGDDRVEGVRCGGG